MFADLGKHPNQGKYIGSPHLKTSLVIEVENLCFSYPGSSELTVRGISFAIDKGEVFGFLGPSGAGKSTTQNILVGLLTGWEGSVRAGGRSLLNKPELWFLDEPTSGLDPVRSRRVYLVLLGRRFLRVAVR